MRSNTFHQLRQLGNVGGYAPRLIAREQSCSRAPGRATAKELSPAGIKDESYV